MYINLYVYLPNLGLWRYKAHSYWSRIKHLWERSIKVRLSN